MSVAGISPAILLIFTTWLLRGFMCHSAQDTFGKVMQPELASPVEDQLQQQHSVL